MKSKFVKIAFIAAIVMVGSITVFNAKKTNVLSSVILANVEALADGEKHDVDCSKEGGECTITAPNGYEIIVKNFQKP